MFDTLASYVDIGTPGAARRVHLRRAGVGPAMLMLHASPMSSQAMLPLMAAVADTVTAIAPDTPGYGFSDPLPAVPADLAPYVAALDALREQLGLERMLLYGTATGAQIGIEYARAHPARVQHLVLDNAASFTVAEHDAIVARYFPDLAPDPLGGHLLRTWTCARDMGLFFPWFDWREASRLPAGGVDPAVTQAFVMDYLQAGPDYDHAYRCAFANEDAERLRAVTVPTTIVRWAGSILKPWTDRFDSIDWPANIRMWPCGPRREDRVEAVRAIAAELGAGVDTGSAAGEGNWARAPAAPGSNTPAPMYQKTPVGQLHLLAGGPGAGTAATVLVHDIGESAAALAPLAAALAGDEQVLVPDLPGHGLSAGIEAVPGFAARTAACLGTLQETWRCPRVRLLLHGRSAALLPALLAALPGLVDSVILLEPPDPAGPAVPVWPLPALRADGAHLADAWFHLRDRELFQPWQQRSPAAALDGNPDLDARRLTARLLDLFRAGPTRELAEAELAAGDWRSAVAAAAVPVILACRAGRPGERRVRALGAQLSLPVCAIDTDAAGGGLPPRADA